MGELFEKRYNNNNDNKKIQKKLLVSCETSEHTEERVNSVTILLRYTDPSTCF